MITNISLVSGTTQVIAKPWFPTLTKIADQLWAMAVPQFGSRGRTDEAVAILRNPSSSADMCEWAERYLCGMEGTNER